MDHELWMRQDSESGGEETLYPVWCLHVRWTSFFAVLNAKGRIEEQKSKLLHKDRIYLQRWYS